jgi:hypothetical protein
LQVPEQQSLPFEHELPSPRQAAILLNEVLFFEPFVSVAEPVADTGSQTHITSVMMTQSESSSSDTFMMVASSLGGVRIIRQAECNVLEVQPFAGLASQ